MITQKKPRKKVGIGTEGKIHISFANSIRWYEAGGKTKIAWWSYDASGEKRSTVTGGLLKRKGLNPGKPDYFFYYIDKEDYLYAVYIEFKKPLTFTADGTKSKAGVLSDKQEIFLSKMSKAKNVNCYICYDVESAINALKKHGLIWD